VPLTDVAIRKVKPKLRPHKLADGEGMYLLVTKTGKGHWRMDFRHNGKRGTIAIGTYPETSLSVARDRRTILRKQLEAGIHPGHQRKQEKIAAQFRTTNTFAAVADGLLEKMKLEGRAAATLEKTRWLFSLVNSHIGHRPVAEISATELLRALKSVESRGRYETARRLRSTCGMVFRFAIATSRAERDPSQDLRGALAAPKPVHRAAITQPESIGAMLRAIDGYDGYELTKLGLQLLAYTFVRPGELRRSEWPEFDLESQVWTIPAAKMKMRRPHRVPLSTQSVQTLRCVHVLTGGCELVFPSVRSSQRPMSENTLNAALRRLGYLKGDVSAHGFRAMASVRLNEMNQWNPDAIERQLAHQEGNEVRRAYNHAAEHWPERQKMMQAWADYLDGLKAGGKVIPLRAVS
jgi:integrase